MKICKKLIFLFSFVLISSFSCEENDGQPACGLEGCNPRRETIKIAEQAIGRTSLLDSIHPNLWVIASQEDIFGQEVSVFDGHDIVAACNLPYSLKE